MNCKYCDSERLIKNMKTFANGTKHLEIICRDCKKQNGYAPQDMSRSRAEKMTMPFGKYIGQSLTEIIENDSKYSEWAADNLDGNIQKAFRVLLNV